jgi:hypothetical protein
LNSPDAQTYSIEEACTAARDRFSSQHDATHHLNLPCVPENAAVPPQLPSADVVNFSDKLVMLDFTRRFLALIVHIKTLSARELCHWGIVG